MTSLNATSNDAAIKAAEQMKAAETAQPKETGKVAKLALGTFNVITFPAKLAGKVIGGTVSLITRTLSKIAAKVVRFVRGPSEAQKDLVEAIAKVKENIEADKTERKNTIRLGIAAAALATAGTLTSLGVAAYKFLGTSVQAATSFAPFSPLTETLLGQSAVKVVENATSLVSENVAAFAINSGTAIIS